MRIAAKGFLGIKEQWLQELPPERYNALVDDTGLRRLVALDPVNRTLRQVADDDIFTAIARYAENELMGIRRDFACYSPHDLKVIRDFVLAMASGLSQDEVLPLATKTQLPYAYERLPFDLDTKEPAPTWEKLLKRCTNTLAIKAFVGSLLDPQANRSQFVYFHGFGNEGKGAMIEALSLILRSAHINQTTPKEMRFWAGSVYNKRLVTLSECDHFHFAVSEDMKAITGNDTISIDTKGVPIFKAKALCKFWFAANVKPQVQDIPAHRRRLIYSEIAPWSGDHIPVRTYVRMLVDEARPFFAECWRTYQKLCPDGGPIPVDEQIFADLSRETNCDFEEILEEYFLLDHKLMCRSRDITGVLNDQKVNNNLHAPFVKFLKTAKCIRYQQRRVVAVSRKSPGLAVTGEQMADPAFIKEHDVVSRLDGLVGIAPKPKFRLTEQFRRSETSPEEWAAFLVQHGFKAEF